MPLNFPLLVTCFDVVEVSSLFVNICSQSLECEASKCWRCMFSLATDAKLQSVVDVCLALQQMFPMSPRNFTMFGFRHVLIKIRTPLCCALLKGFLPTLHLVCALVFYFWALAENFRFRFIILGARITVSPRFEWQTAINQSVGADKAPHSFDRRFYSTVRYHFFSVNSRSYWSHMDEKEKRSGKCFQQTNWHRHMFAGP